MARSAPPSEGGATTLPWRQELTERPNPPAVTVTEVPLLYETGGDSRFDVVVVITASPRRAPHDDRSRDTREQRLIPEDEKLGLADYAYVNDGTLEELDDFVGRRD